MKTFVCIALLAACALAAPAPEEGKREKRGFLSGYGHGLGSIGSYSSYSSPIISSYSSPIISHAPIVYSSPAIVHEPAIISVKKIVSVPRVVAVKKIVSVPHVSYVSAPYVSSYAPSYSSGWW